MDIIVNNQSHSVQSPTIEELTKELSVETKGVAIALNNKVIQRSLWGTTPLQEGDKVVIVSAVFGG